MVELDQQQQQRQREKNRVAACRSRQRKREDKMHWIQQYIVFSRRNEELKEEAARLRGTLRGLRTMALSEVSAGRLRLR